MSAVAGFFAPLFPSCTQEAFKRLDGAQQGLENERLRDHVHFIANYWENTYG